jgi:hypothetical protein
MCDLFDRPRRLSSDERVEWWISLETIDIAPDMSLMRVLYRTHFRLANLIPGLGLLESAS